MEKEKSVRNKSHERIKMHEDLPKAPPDPTTVSEGASAASTPSITVEPQPVMVQHRKESDPFERISSYKDREKAFLTELSENIRKCAATQQAHSPASVRDSANEDSGLGNKGSDFWDSDDTEDTENLIKECDEFINPLINRTGASISVALSTKGALDQLDSLHKLVHQFLNLQEQNLRMTRAAKSANTLYGLMMTQNQARNDPRKTTQTSTSTTDELSDLDFDNEIEQNMALLEQILSAGSTASSKRESSKRGRSKSVMSEEITKESPRNYPLRRQSAIVDFKPKVSKWTKVKAAFKWEKANALPDDTHGKTSGKKDMLHPMNTELARYLRVPSMPCTGVSSGDSVISTSSRDIGFTQSPDNLSTASSEDEANPQSKSKMTSKEELHKPEKRSSSEDAKRSYSLDSDTVLSVSGGKQFEKIKNKSAWSKVKGIVKTHRGSLKVSASRSSTTQASLEGSRDVSPCESLDTGASAFEVDRNDSFSSSQTSPGLRNTTPTFTITTPAFDSGSHSPSSFVPLHEDATKAIPSRPMRKAKHVPDIQSLPEGKTLPESISSHRKAIPSPLSLKHDSSDAEVHEFMSPTGKLCGPRRPTTLSMPNSPMKTFEFFTEFESTEASSADFSEPNTPQRKLSDKSKNLLQQREEIKKNYVELQRRLQHEFENKQMEWERIRPALSTSPVHSVFKDDLKAVRPVTEEDLPPDFKKKLDEWRTKKSQQSIKDAGQGSSKESSKEPEKKKNQTTDWEAWKTGHTKLPGQGLAVLPNAKDLPEDFQKKLSEWKQMKAANKIPPYSSQSSTSGECIKRQSIKKQMTKTSVYTSVKKSKTVDDIEKHKAEALSKLKALVTTEAPKKELVVQTTKGVMKFEGISRKFTRKLYEWEKARGIGPEASTFALLHPGYKPVIVESSDSTVAENKRDKSPALQRSFSCDSISPNVSHPSISHQPSSLSLNDMDDLKDNLPTKERRTSSQPDIDLQSDDPGGDEELEAVIVEVEDDVADLSQGRSPAISGDEAYIGHDDDFYSIQSTIEAVKSVSFLSIKCNEIVIKLDIKQMRQSLQALIDCLPKMSAFMAQRTVPLQLIRQLAYEIIRLLNSLADHMEEKRDVEPKITAINDRFNSLKEILDKVYLRRESRTTAPSSSPSSPLSDSPTKKIPELSVTPVYGAHATQVVENNAKIKATVNVTPTYVCTEIKFDKTAATPTSLERKSSDRDLDSGTSQPQSSSMESEHKQDNRKLQRNLSTGSRRKVRLKRMGSRQNSKTEESASSEEEAMNYVLEAPKKVKRKTSKCKAKEPEKVSDVTHTDDIVYVVKLKPTLATDTEVTFDFQTTASKEGHIELINEPEETIPTPLTASVLIKTKRKIFSPIDQTTEGEICTATGIELESPPKESDLNVSQVPAQQETDQVQKLRPSKPPLPQSPRLQEQRKLSVNKDMAPNIRLMIAKYNNKINTESQSPGGSGSGSPVAWRSPVLDRRVKIQTAKYQAQVGLCKSSSTGSVKRMEESPLAARKVQKSQSNKDCSLHKQESEETIKVSTETMSTLKDSSQNGSQIDSKDVSDEYYDTVLSYDALKKKLMKNLEIQRSVCDDISKLADDVERSWIEQKQLDVSKGAIRKIPKTSPTYLRSASLFEKNEQKVLKKQEQVRPALASSTSVSPDIFIDSKPPKSPVSQRAEKLRKAKEEFLQMSIEPVTIRAIDRKVDATNRLSQVSTISCSSTEEPQYLLKSSSTGDAYMPSSSSLDRRNIQQGMYESEPYDSSFVSENTGSKFNLSNIASKLRKVKLRKNSKELKLGAVTTLCRQSLMADITGESIKAEITSASSKTSLNDSSNVKKCESSHIFSRFFRPSKDKLKKSHSLSLLQQIHDNRKHSK